MSNSPGLGATIVDGGVHFAVWALKAQLVEVEIEGDDDPSFHALGRDGDGTHSGIVPRISAGALYRYRLDGDSSYPDPYARFQPAGPHGASEVIDPERFSWTDGDWPGITMDGLVIYECHVGTYTPPGTFEALERELPELRRLGVGAVELMPIAEFPGRRNWGYDGVDLFAPSHTYGRPDDLRRLVDAAHREGLGVIIDVVYNHLGPDGNYLRAFSDDYFTDRHQTPWGDGINYDGPHSEWVRRFVVDNAVHWIREYHIDSLRIDAPHAIVDDSPTHILAELAGAVRTATTRHVVLIAESDTRSIAPRSSGGYDLDAVWADDFHHEVRVLLTNAHEMYYANYAGSLEQVAFAIEHGFPDRHDALPPAATVFCIQNHDQVGNRPFGERIHHEISLERYAAVSTLLLFCPQPVVVFMGQEFAASTPFLFFTDHEPALGARITRGRQEEFQGFPAFADDDLLASIPDPQAESTYLASKLDSRERRTNRPVFELYRTLLQLRRDDPVLSQTDRGTTKANALSARVIAVHRWHDPEHRLLIANFGPSMSLPLKDVPSIAPQSRSGWRIMLSTSPRRFGGSGQRATICGRAANRTVVIPARTAVILGATVR